MMISIRNQETHQNLIGMLRGCRLAAGTSLLSTALLAVTSFLAVPAQAVEVVVSFEASLIPGTCGLDCLGALGGTLSGTFTYESTSSGSGANPTTYPLSSFDFTTVSGVEGGATFGTLAIADNVSSPPADAVTIAGGGLFGAFSTATLSALNFQMIDEDGTVFSNTDLPTSAPPLSAFETAFLNMTWTEFGIPIWAPTWEITSLTWGVEPDLLIDFDTDPQGAAISAGTEMNLVYRSLGVIFERVGPGTLCGPEVYANSNQPVGFGSSPNVVSVCNEGIASDISENRFGMVEAIFAVNASDVCVDVRPDGPTHAAVLRAFDADGMQIGEVTSVLGVTQQLCISGAGIRAVRFSGDGSLFARFDNVEVRFLPEPGVFTGLVAGLLLLLTAAARGAADR